MVYRNRLTLCAQILPIMGFLCMASASRGQAIYVDPVSGNDANNGMSDSQALRTIDRAWNLVADGNTIKLMAGIYDSSSQGKSWRIHIDLNKTVTFEPAGPDDQVVLQPDGSPGIYFDSTSSASTVTFRDVTITSMVSTQLISWSSSRAIGAVFQNCTLDSGPRRLIELGADASASRRVVLENCSMTTSYDYPIWIENVSLFKMHNCTYQGSATTWYSSVIQITSNIGSLEIDGCTCQVSTNFLRPTRVAQANAIRVTNNTIRIRCPDASYRTAICLPNVLPISRVTVSGNTITNEGGNIRAIVMDAPLSAQPPLDPKYDRIVVSQNVLNMLDPATSSYGIQIGLNVSQFNCEENRVYDANFGIFVQGRSGLVHQNLLVAKNPIVVFGGSQNRIQQNTAISYGTESRAIVLGRNSWFGGELQQGNPNASYLPDSIMISGSPDLTSARSALACGLKLMAMTKAPGNIQKYGWVSSIGDPGSVVTVGIDQWYGDGGEPTAVRPADRTPLWILTFPFGNVITNNIFDASDGTYCITFDFNPQCGEDLIDYNCYLRGSACLSNLDFYGMGRSIMDLSSLQSKWKTWSKDYPDCDKHSLSFWPEYVDAPNRDFHLSITSPLIDSGTSNFLTADVLDLDNDMDYSELVPYDLDGKPRFVGVAVDIGAYEYDYPCATGDLNCDGVVNDLDITEMLLCANGPGIQVTSTCRQSDLDEDGDSDQVDFAILQRNLGSGSPPTP